MKIYPTKFIVRAKLVLVRRTNESLSIFWLTKFIIRAKLVLVRRTNESLANKIHVKCQIAT